MQKTDTHTHRECILALENDVAWEDYKCKMYSCAPLSLIPKIRLLASNTERERSHKIFEFGRKCIISKNMNALQGESSARMISRREQNMQNKRGETNFRKRDFWEGVRH
jgi:REP element-mobilizing transposase RayT